MDIKDCKPGMRVQVSLEAKRQFALRFGEIMKVNKVNVLVALEGGGTLSAHPSFLLDPSVDRVSAAAAQVTTFTPEPLPPTPGTVVRVPNSDKIKGLHVVIGDGTMQGRLVAKITKLGGEDGNRYWRVLPSRLEVVDLETVKELLPA